MTTPQFQLDNICPYNVEEKVSVENIKNICEQIAIKITTSPKLLSIDINLYYEGYFHHKRLSSLTKKQANDKLNKVSKATSELLKVLENIEQNEDSFIFDHIDARLYLAALRKENEVGSFYGLVKTLKSLEEELSDPFKDSPGKPSESSPQEWFLGKAIPYIFQKHTGQIYSRAYNSDTGKSGKPHKFTKEILRYLEEFELTTDSAINTAPKNYSKSLKKEGASARIYGWPYKWSDYYREEEHANLLDLLQK